MRMLWTVATRRAPDGTGVGGMQEIEVEAPAGTTCAGVADALADALGSPAVEPRLWLGGAPVPPETPVGTPPLVDGACVSLVQDDQPTPVRGTPRTPRSPVVLAVSHGPDAGRTAELATGSHTVGRAGTADLCLADLRLSRVHAELTVTSAGIHLRDLGSTNGTTVAGRPVGPDPVPVLAGDPIAMGDSILVVRAASGVPAATTWSGDGTRAVNRRPRLPGGPAATVIALPTPPTPPRRVRVPWVAMVLPIPFAAGVAFFFGPTMLAFALMGPLMMAGTALGDRFGSRRTYAAELAEHSRHLAAATERVAAACAAEARSLRHTLPDPVTVLTVATGPGARLWERRRGDPDALDVTVGRCTLPSSLRVARPAGDDGPEHLPLPGVPCRIRLAEVGVLGICGPRETVQGTVRSVLGQLATLHSPLDVAFDVVRAAPGPDDAWDWLARLPHLREPGGSPRTVGVATQGTEDASAQAVITRLAGAVRERGGDQAPERGSGSPWQGPRTVLVLDDCAALRGLPDLSFVLERGPAVGIHCVALDSTRSRLPAEAHAVLDLGDPGQPRLVLPGGEVADVAVDRVGPWWADRLSRALAPLRDATPDGEVTALPDSVRFAGLLPFAVDARAVADQWLAQPHGTAVPVGTTQGGPLVLDLAADGPHLLVAGTTGSGKSELLRTLVASLAVHNRPEHLSFVLVDYKGGAAFAECAGLPHTAGVVTDLDPHLAERALTSLTAELTRRERLVAAAGVSDFAAYQRVSSSAPEPLARLVIVIDEFRALAEELPDFVAGVVRIAALGRSLGVHVVLATQRPAGVVTADIRANVNLRIALRVRDRADSDDVIDAPDAARLDAAAPGRALARTGGGDLIAFQTARVGAVAPGSRGLRIRSAPGRPRTLDWSEEPEAVDGASDLAALVEAVTAAGRALGAHPARPAWLPTLPEHLEVTDLPPSQHRFRVPIGLVDRPRRQLQERLEVDVAAAGHWGFVGGPGSGRSLALLGIATGLATRHGPDDLHLYAVSGGSLAALGELAHCGAHVGWDDLPRLGRLLDRLTTLVAARRRDLEQSHHDSFASWLHAAGGEPAPAPVVLLVDDWDLLAQRTDEPTHGAVVTRLLALLREGAGVGLTAVVAGDRALLVGRVAAAVTHRVVLRLADLSDCALAGLPASALPSNPAPGRGVLRDGGEVQLALPEPRGRARLTPHGHRPPARVEPLPTVVAARELSRAEDDDRCLLGIGGDEAVPLGLSPALDGRRWVVVGAAGRGVSTTLALVAEDLLRSGRAVAVAVARAGPLDALRHDPRLALWCDATDPDDADALVTLRRDVPDLAVVVDGADELVDLPLERVLREVGARVDDDGGLIVVGANATTLMTQYRGLAVEVARHRTGVLLGPSATGEPELLGLRVPVDRDAPPGRGLLVRRGAGVPVQVALVSPGAATPPVAAGRGAPAGA